MLTKISTFLKNEIRQVRPNEDDHMIWLGDFNRHHPLWEDKTNGHLMTNSHLQMAQLLIELLVEYGMIMVLPKYTPTLEASSTKNWTCPDNIFCTEHMAEILNSCYINPS